MTYPRCKEDCYWYEEWQDMNAHIPYCRCKGADFIKPQDCENCEQYHSKYKPTNADKIRKMSDEKLAAWIADIAMCNNCRAKNMDIKKPCKGLYDGCKGNWLDWLKQEVEK